MQEITDAELKTFVSEDQFRRMGNKSILLVGAGDLASKKEPLIRLLKMAGATIFLADNVEDKHSKAMKTYSDCVTEFFYLGDSAKLLALKKIEIDVLDVSTWGDSHLFTAGMWQHNARIIVDTKPIDTNIGSLRTIRKYAESGNPSYAGFIDKLVVHDHYAGRWVIQEASDRMPIFLQDEGYAKQIQVFILEKNAVEPDRLDALSEGLCADLLPHAIKVIQQLFPVGAKWFDNDGRQITRTAFELNVLGGARERNLLCPLSDDVETFSAVSLRGVDVVMINSNLQRPFRWPVEIFIAVGKGVAGNPGDNRDTKGLSITFQSGNTLNLDMESQKIQLPTGTIIDPPPGPLHRGINLPLIDLLAGDLEVKWSELDGRPSKYFQHPFAAHDGAELIEIARRQPWLGRSYRVGGDVMSLINSIPLSAWGPTPWQLRHLPLVQLGTRSPGTDVP